MYMRNYEAKETKCSNTDKAEFIVKNNVDFAYEYYQNSIVKATQAVKPTRPL